MPARPTLLLGLAVVLAAVASAALPVGSAAAKKKRPSAAAGFVHPGVLVSRPQLAFVRTQVRAGRQPWKAAFEQMMASSYAAPGRMPSPRPIVECGSYSRPNNGCTDERQDAIAAYTNALAWYITRDPAYARKAISLMDAWSAVLLGHTNSNAPLQAGWAGSVWPRAAEIIRATYRRWPYARRFGRMLRHVYLPQVIKGSDHNGNWELTMMEAAVGISVFLEDRATYRTAIRRFLARVPAYVYARVDGDRPLVVPGSGLRSLASRIEYWQGQSTLVRGLSQETCRDFTHTGYGLSAISHIAETSRIQRRSLYPRVAGRLRNAFAFHARYELGARVPQWLCGGKLDLGLGPVTEVALNALHNRLGYPMTYPRRLTARMRPEGTNNLFVAWETLTHARNPR